MSNTSVCRSNSRLASATRHCRWNAAGVATYVFFEIPDQREFIEPRDLFQLIQGDGLTQVLHDIRMDVPDRGRVRVRILGQGFVAELQQ